MVTESFKDFVLDQLGSLGEVNARRMFSGFGLYAGKVFFGIIADDRLYFKTDEKTRQFYLEQKMKPFAPSRKQVLKNYYEVPSEVIEDREKILELAEETVALSIGQ